MKVDVGQARAHLDIGWITSQTTARDAILKNVERCAHHSQQARSRATIAWRRSTGVGCSSGSRVSQKAGGVPPGVHQTIPRGGGRARRRYGRQIWRALLVGESRVRRDHFVERRSLVAHCRSDSFGLSLRAKVAPTQVAVEVHSDHHLGAHGPTEGNRNRIHNATVHQPIVTDQVRSENARHGDTGSYRIHQESFAEPHLPSGADVGGDRTECASQMLKVCILGYHTGKMSQNRTAAHQSRAAKYCNVH
mmetsp:Transcript_11877/g.36150  ORF Transcript_11877/g.36150 Transcript_11877/m.36150 type:complete len:249 (+) Transcript_11877:175-921(+)